MHVESVVWNKLHGFYRWTQGRINFLVLPDECDADTKY